jgi:hypothetical protein
MCLFQTILYNFEVIYGVLGTIEVLFLATFITLRSNFINNAFMADLNVYAYALQAESLAASRKSQSEKFRSMAKEWLTASEHYRYAAESRTYSLNFSIYSLVFLLISLALALLPKVTCWPSFLFVSIGFLAAAMANFIFNRSAKCKITKWLYEPSLKCKLLFLPPEPERPKISEVCTTHEFRKRSRWPDIQELICNNDWLKEHLQHVQKQLDEGSPPKQDC